MDNNKNTEESISTSIYPFIIGSLIIIGFWLLSILLINFLFDNTYNENSAWFGDSFGAINSLFSGLAFAGIIYTILLQRKELQLQRKELRETKDELRRSADAQEKTEKSFNEQLKVMQITALIDGYSKSAEYYWEQERKAFIPKQKNEFRHKAEVRTKLMESLIDEIGSSYNQLDKLKNKS